ncbi:mitochondrial 54S ribosomal protein YmL40 [Martiniozyma asiatica (nom. inval.)]|nr:mitochondrial 54S ribosomal protein YmL40 [Martiniozyma asiatica]
MSLSSKLFSKRYPGTLASMTPATKARFQKMQDQATPAFQRSNDPLVEDKKQFKTPQQWKMQVGDKVLINSGPHKGTVSEVMFLQQQTNSVFLQVHQSKKVVVPKEWWAEGQNSYVTDFPLSYKPHQLKIVTTLEQDGVQKQIAADDVVFKGEKWDAEYKQMMPIRRVKFNEHIIIPWPRPTPENDDAYSTTENIAHARTYFVDSVIGDTFEPTDLLQSLRHPLMKRPYKWGKKTFTAAEIKKLSSPDMPLNEAKKAGMEERAAIRASLPSEPSVETIDLVGTKVAEFLNNIENPHLAKFVEKMDPSFKDPRDLIREKKKELYQARVEENKEMNTIKERVVKKYKRRF